MGFNGLENAKRRENDLELTCAEGARQRLRLGKYFSINDFSDPRLITQILRSLYRIGLHCWILIGLQDRNELETLLIERFFFLLNWFYSTSRKKGGMKVVSLVLTTWTRKSIFFLIISEVVNILQHQLIHTQNNHLRNCITPTRKK